MTRFKDLRVWPGNHELSLSTCKLRLLFSEQETYGLISQLQRVASSIPANIREGCGCNGGREFVHCPEVALRSGSELRHYILPAPELTHLGGRTYEEVDDQVAQTKMMLSEMIQVPDAES